MFCLNIFPISAEEKFIDYSYFYGRVSDLSKDQKMIRFSTENRNIKLFRAGDTLRFRVIKDKDGEECIGHVRDSDENYLVFSVTSYAPCLGDRLKMRIGNILRVNSEALFSRIKDAKVFREVLKKRKKDFLSQLNEVNTWLWTFKQQKLKSTAKYDQEISKLQLAKQQEISNLNLKRKDYLHLQRELKFRLDKLDQDLELYRIENSKVLRDRWAKDRDLGIEVVSPYKKIN